MECLVIIDNLLFSILSTEVRTLNLHTLASHRTFGPLSCTAQRDRIEPGARAINGKHSPFSRGAMRVKSDSCVQEVSVSKRMHPSFAATAQYVNIVKADNAVH